MIMYMKEKDIKQGNCRFKGLPWVKFHSVWFDKNEKSELYQKRA